LHNVDVNRPAREYTTALWLLCCQRLEVVTLIESFFRLPFT
jgi:hypothetical protein